MAKSRKPSLVYIGDDEAGFSRTAGRSGFAYQDQSGKTITEEDQLRRIAALAIPPAWSDVWICPRKNGYLQATGRDEKGRKQYIYHEKWIAYRQARKFDHLLRFAEMLPVIRKTTRLHLRDKEWSRRKILALVVQVLDETAIRIGNKAYKEQNDTYGLTTMRRKHLELSENGLQFSFKGKSGQYRQVKIANKKLNRLIKACSELPGYEIFRYRKADGKFYTVDSQDVNEYLQLITQEEFSSKDFRTWLATAAALEFWPVVKKQQSGKSLEKQMSELVKAVANELGNTASVCRKYYIHPKIMAAFSAGELPNAEEIKALFSKELKDELDDCELLALHLIRQK